MPPPRDAASLDFYRSRFPDFWASVAGEPYATFAAHVMSGADVARVRSAAADAWRITARVAPIMRAMPDAELLAIGIPSSALRVCRFQAAALNESFLARFDFALTDDGPKVLEINAETPMFLWESFEIAGAAARALGYEDPNAGTIEHLRDALARAVGPASTSRVAVTAYNTWREDWFSAVFAARVASEALNRQVDVVPLHELRVTGGALRDLAGDAIDVLWRMYPLEHFAADRNGPALFDLVENASVRLINPPSALLLQNKAALAIVWALAQNGVWYDANERATIERLFLPTFLDLPPGDDVYVRKPVLGREGNSVALVRGTETLIEAPARTYVAQPCVYQRCVPLPQIQGGSGVVTCFVVDGKPSAIAARAGHMITDGQARFVPVGTAT